MLEWTDYIPCTSPRTVADGIEFRPIRSWSSATYAGEGLRIHRGDRSGCIEAYDRCRPPKTVTHRVYTNFKTEKQISAFLSYPDAMGYWGNAEYFWEIYPAADGDIARFGTEDEMEKEVVKLLREEAPR